MVGAVAPDKNANRAKIHLVGGDSFIVQSTPAEVKAILEAGP